MKAIILAGGSGTRLQSVVWDVPKPMAPVNGRPFLEFLIKRLVDSGITEIILSIGYLHEKIISYFGDGSLFGASISYCVESEPLGTGGAIRESLKILDAETALIMNGDTFSSVDTNSLASFHSNMKAMVSMAVVPISDASRYGTVLVTPEGRVKLFLEKQAIGSNLVNSGTYICNNSLLDLFSTGNVSFENDILPIIINKGLLAAQIQDVPFIDIGIPEDYQKFCLNHSVYTAGH